MLTMSSVTDILHTSSIFTCIRHLRTSKRALHFHLFSTYEHKQARSNIRLCLTLIEASMLSIFSRVRQHASIHSKHKQQYSSTRRSFFQSLCALGYCALPLVVAAVTSRILSMAHVYMWFVHVPVVGMSLAWSIFGMCSPSSLVVTHLTHLTAGLSVQPPWPS